MTDTRIAIDSAKGKDRTAECEFRIAPDGSVKVLRIDTYSETIDLLPNNRLPAPTDE